MLRRADVFLYFCAVNHRILLLWLFAAVSIVGVAQRTQILSERLKTVRLAVDGDDSRLPILTLDRNQTLEVSFDDLTHEYTRYTYHIEHCGADWQPTEGLFESEYLVSANNEEVIETYEPSLNTTVLYNHYSFSLPNANMQPLLSGNYRLTISCEDEAVEKQPVVHTYFSIVEPLVSISATVSDNTEIDLRNTHQQLALDINFAGLPIIDARKELKAVILQNRRWDNAKINPPATSATGNHLLWEHDRNLIFKAGNEYRKFELLSTRIAGLHVDNLRWYDPYYHASLLPDRPRNNYIYDEDQNGRNVVRTDGESSYYDTESDYVWVHFTLEQEKMNDQEVYLNGRWTYDSFAPDYRMTYNEASQAYEATLLLKQGYYSYQYLTVKKQHPRLGETGPVEGDFFQTENEYTVLIYYRAPSGRYDRLVGVGQLHSR